ncbi:MAG: tRNA pseudouridine(55) synthase TruB [Betaproteobacteria bacterium]|nr:tRNA pseudouridine(55) synthase TruB [Betaproteobacteria bacterium]
MNVIRTPRPPRRRVDGILLLDKPPGVTSNAALQRARRAYRAEKAGHTGTLDPLASGLLPLCFGEATKFAQSLLDSRKEYVATLAFGTSTTTGDAEGEVVDTAPVDFSPADLAATLRRFEGEILQLPPLHSALKFEGRAYYEYARAGQEVPRTPRPVTIEALEIVECALPRAVVRVACSKGTYVRVLAEDIARALGSRAHLAGLRRTRSGPFRVADAIGLDALEAADPAGIDAFLLPVDAALAGLPRRDLDAPEAAALHHGRTVACRAEADGSYRCYGPDGAFCGVAVAAGGVLRAGRMMRTATEDSGPRV